MKNIKAISILVLVVVLAVSCNTKPSSYATNQPWSGIKPMSAVISGYNYIAKIGSYTANTPPANSILFTATSDTNWTDSTANDRTFSFILPNGGGAASTSFLIDTANKDFTATYVVTKKSLQKANLNKVISTNVYTSSKSVEGLRMQNYVNSATDITGLFYGYLTRTDGLKSVYIENGYFSVKK